VRVLGNAIFAAKCSVITWYPTDDYYYGPAVLYTLFGDPALRIKQGAPTAISEPTARPPTPGPWPQLSASPNPARGSTVIAFPSPRVRASRLRVYDSRGGVAEVVAVAPGVSHVTLDLSGFSAGVYFVTVSEPGRGSASETRKLVVR
jgi:hypothetical protein